MISEQLCRTFADISYKVCVSFYDRHGFISLLNEILMWCAILLKNLPRGSHQNSSHKYCKSLYF